MRILITFTVCLLSLVANAAFPPFQGFYGSGGITVTTNITLGTVTIGGAPSGGSSSTNATASAVTNMLWSKVRWIDATYGRDATAVESDATKPWLNPHVAAATATAGTLLYMRAGTYDIGLTNINLPHGVSLLGDGMGVTILRSSVGLFTNGPVIIPGSTSTVGRLTVVLTARATRYQAAVGSEQASGNKAFTNAFIFDIANEGDSDCFFANRQLPCSGLIYNVALTSKWDAFAFIDAAHQFDVYNGRIIVDNKGANFPESQANGISRPVLLGSGSRLRMFNSYLVATNGATSHGAVLGSGNDRFEFYGGRIEAAGTNSVFHIYGDEDSSFIVNNGFTTLTNVSGPAGVPTGLPLSDAFGTSSPHLTRPSWSSNEGGLRFIDSRLAVPFRLPFTNGPATWLLTTPGTSGDMYWSAPGSGGTNFPGGASFPGEETIFWWQPNIWGNDTFVLTNNGHGVLWAFDPVNGQSTFTTPLAASNSFRVTGNQTNHGSITIIPNAGSGKVLTSDANGVGTWKPTYVVNIVDYGAIGDGATDNFVAVSNANVAATASNLPVFIPPMTFQGSNFTFTCPGVFGCGTNSVLKMAPGAAGVFLNFTKDCAIRDFAVDGTNYAAWDSGVITAGTRIGVNAYAGGPSDISGLVISGFDLTGLQVSGSNGLERCTARIMNNTIYKCNFGLSNVLGSGEYNHYFNNMFRSNTLDLISRAANVKVSFNSFTDSYGGGVQNGSGGARGHAEWTDNTYNHLGAGSTMTWATNAQNGIFHRNRCLASALDGHINIFSCTNLDIAGNQGFSINVANSTCGPIQFHDNTLVGRMVDQTLGKLKHWNNYGTSGELVDGTGNPYFAPGGYGLETSLSFIMRGTIRSDAQLWTNQAPAIASSNLVWNFNTNSYQLTGLTNVVFTNLVELVGGSSGQLEAFIHNTTAVTMGIVWPAYGAQHGYFFNTNTVNDVLSLTSLAAGEKLHVKIKAFGTNMLPEAYRYP